MEDMLGCGPQRSHGFCTGFKIMSGKGGTMGGPYNAGCGGGRGATTMQYLKDWGLTWAACKPYTAGAVHLSALFLKPDPHFQPCGRTCVKAFRDAHPTRQHEYFSGGSIRCVALGAAVAY